mmetsp:Transcript_83900/g.148385  ORF Transcript_83900/g.148385 Transcript_83900/m.148385 type:complete len:249 (+) Transcript_83900:320-1066(+)
MVLLDRRKRYLTICLWLLSLIPPGCRSIHLWQNEIAGFLCIIGGIKSGTPFRGKATKRCDANTRYLTLFVVFLHGLSDNVHYTAGGPASNDPCTGSSSSLHKPLREAINVEFLGAELHLSSTTHDRQEQLWLLKAPFWQQNCFKQVFRLGNVRNQAVLRCTAVKSNFCYGRTFSMARSQGGLENSAAATTLSYRRILVSAECPGDTLPQIAEFCGSLTGSNSGSHPGDGQASAGPSDILTSRYILTSR